MLKNCKLTIRFSEEEEKIIEERAQRANMSKSEYVREKALGREIVGSMAKTDIAKHLIYIQYFCSSLGVDHEKNKVIKEEIRKEVDQTWQYLR